MKRVGLDAEAPIQLFLCSDRRRQFTAGYRRCLQIAQSELNGGQIELQHLRIPKDIWIVGNRAVEDTAATILPHPSQRIVVVLTETIAARLFPAEYIAVVGAKKFWNYRLKKPALEAVENSGTLQSFFDTSVPASRLVLIHGFLADPNTFKGEQDFLVLLLT